MSGDRRRSLVADEMESDRVGTGDENGRQRRPIIRHLPDNQSRSPVVRPLPGRRAGVQVWIPLHRIHRHPLVPFFAHSQRLFESSPPLLRPAERENRTLFNCSSSHFSSAIYLATAIVVRSVENSFKCARMSGAPTGVLRSILDPLPASLRLSIGGSGAPKLREAGRPGGREIASKGNTRDKVHARSSPRVAAPGASRHILTPQD